MMFAGMIRVENTSKTLNTDTDSPCHRCAVRTDGVNPSGNHRKRSFRRPGYMRSEPINQLDTAETSCDSEHQRSPISKSSAVEKTQKSASELPSEKWLTEGFKRDNSKSSKNDHLHDEEDNLPMQSRDVFNSSFSFIQQSLDTCDLLDVNTCYSPRTEHKQSESTSQHQLKFEASKSGLFKPPSDLMNHLSQSETSIVQINQLETSTVPGSLSETRTVPVSQSKSSFLKPISALMNHLSQSETITVPINQSETSTAPVSQSNSGFLKPLSDLMKHLTQSESSIVSMTQSETNIISINQSETITIPMNQSKNSTVPVSQSNSDFLKPSSALMNRLSQSETVTIPMNQSETSTIPVSQSNSGFLKPPSALITHLSESESVTVPMNQSETSTDSLSQSEHDFFSSRHLPCSFGQSAQQKSLLLDRELWLVDLDMQTSSSMMSNYAKENIQDSDSGSLDAEITSSHSIDSSDSTSSGYESTTPSSDQSRDGLMKKYEDFLQDCLQNNRTNTKIESIMMKLQRLQHKAILDDDYDTAERFGKKLEELRRERATLKPGLPSRHPEVIGYLERLRTAVNSAIYRTDSDCRHTGELSEDQRSCSAPSRAQTRETLLEEKQRIQREMCDVQRRLQGLQERSRALELQLELQEMQGPVLRAADSPHLHLTARALEDLLTSEHRQHISISPPAHIRRLEEQERVLSLSIREAETKVLLNQRLCFSLRQKVSESETQLLALHEAKLTAVSGNDFSSAKELKAEIRSVYRERDRLELLHRKLQTLSKGSGLDLSRMKERHKHIKLELQDGEAQYGEKRSTFTLFSFLTHGGDVELQIRRTDLLLTFSVELGWG
ncbi:disrupted in schizophrenia 1 protein [Danio aesculapii]|uniref:disrupted in schizophrenia 1 protein n=1 Tax=Danio aesculapii TaxID=1142201 RepID=UPI0024BFF5F3|nr:disrupted in schizophrenia 1 protein [Danio aesculapii]